MHITTTIKLVSLLHVHQLLNEGQAHFLETLLPSEHAQVNGDQEEAVSPVNRAVCSVPGQ